MPTRAVEMGAVVSERHEDTARAEWHAERAVDHKRHETQAARSGMQNT
jgi:hypothetical protein